MEIDSLSSADRQSIASLSSEQDPRERDQELYRFLVDSLTEYAVFAVSLEGAIISWNSGAEKIFGYTKKEITGQQFDLIFTQEDIAIGAPRSELVHALAGGKIHIDRWHVRKDGSRFWGTNTVQPLYDREGVLRAYTKLVRDTTATYLTIEALSDSEQRLRLLFESARDYAIFSIGLDGAITTWSAGAQRIFEYQQSEVIGRNFSMLFRPAEAASAADELRDAGLAGSVAVERWLLRKSGSSFLASGKTARLTAGDPAGNSRGYVKIVHDTTEQHEAAEAMRRRAQYDALTELPNRQHFYEHVRRAIAILKRRSSSCFAILFIDLDNFKMVNDTYGHIVADDVLSKIARRLERCARSEDVVARVGGDEFAILLNGISGTLDADDAAQRILVAMQDAIDTPAGDVIATVSVGIALGTVKHEQPEDVLHDADVAMYVAKTQGRGRAIVFDESIGTVARDNTALMSALRHAIGRNELRVAYQPVVRLRDGCVVGFEALARWKHPRRGILLPKEFIPCAEESNLIVAIDRWVLARACTQFRTWHRLGLVKSALQMSVNVSSREFSRIDFPDDLRSMLDTNEVAATSLRLEITESTLLERSPRAYATLAAVRALGVQIDVDDFGTGYASLGALNDIAVDGLKIDWSFVTSKNSRNGWQIVEAVIRLAHSLGLAATAEGIETAEQRDKLIALRCDLGQGFLFAPALGPVAATDFLRKVGH